MTLRCACFALVAVALAAPPIPVAAESPAQSYAYRERQSRTACRPPLKLAAGACLRRCPAGYADQGRYCRLRSQRS